MPKKCCIEGCDNDVFTHGYCYTHKGHYYQNRDYGKPQKKRSRPKPMSEKRAVELSIYRPIRDKYMLLHPKCEVKGCRRQSNDLHHKKGREHNRYADHWAKDNDVSLLVDVRYFMAVCRQCHTKFDLDPLWAKENGYVLK